MSLLDYPSLYDRFGGGDFAAYPMTDKDKRRLFRQGLLEFAANVSRPNGGNFANSLATGLLSAKQGMSEGAQQYANDAYRSDIMQRTRDEMAANTAKQKAWANLYAPDGSIDPQGEAALRAADPQGYLSNMDKLHPTQKREYHLLETGAGTVPVFSDDAGNLYDMNGQKVNFGGAPQANAMSVSPGPAFPMRGNDLYASIGNVIGPLGGRITSTNGGKHNPGSLHYDGRAVDVGMARETPEQQQQIISALEAAGYKVRDERQRPAGQAVWGGPHVHVEAGQQTAQASPRTGFESLPGFVPKAKDAGKVSTVTQRAQDLADMQAQGITVTKAMRDQYLMTGKMPGGEGDTAIPGDASKTGDDYLATLDSQTASQVKALAEGRMAFPTGTALKSPHWQAMLGAVSQYDPNFDAVNYNARSNTRKAFTSGKEAGQINALNTVAEHLGQFSDNAEALDNSRFPMWNRIANKTLEELGDPRIAAFNTNKKAVADEVAKVWRASGGSEADIQENLKNLDGAQSPEQLRAAIGTLTDLIYGKIAALQDQYNSGMGTTQKPRPLVSPEAQQAFDKTLRRMHGDMSPDKPAPGKVLRYDPTTGDFH